MDIVCNHDDEENRVDPETAATDEFARRDVISPFLNMLSTIIDGETMASLVANLENRVEDYPFEHSKADPFKSLGECVLIAFFEGASLNLSNEVKKCIMEMIQTLFYLKELDPNMKLPAPDRVIHYEQRKDCRIPKMIPTRHIGTNKKGEEHPYYMTAPRSIIRNLMADPLKNPQLSSLPDYTTGEMNCLQQGEKWKYHPMFQTPMIILGNGNQIWTGDMVEMNTSLFGVKHLLVTKFFKKKELTNIGASIDTSADRRQYVSYAEGYLVAKHSSLTSEGVVSRVKFQFPLSHLIRKVPGKIIDFLRFDQGHRFESNEYGQIIITKRIDEDHDSLISLWNGRGPSEKWKRYRADGSLQPVYLTPMNFFTDDTSGNLSKQYNLFDSYLMTPAAMSYDAKSSKNNNFFICTSNKKLSAVDMLPAIVDDLVELEKGVEMYSISHKETVLVVAPLLLIQADNYRHSELSMHKGSAAGYFCRKCTIKQTKDPNPKPRKNTNLTKRAEMNLANANPKALPKVLHKYPRRTIKDLRSLVDASNDEKDFLAHMNTMGYTKNGSEQLLRLLSYDPTLDTPIELLHTLPLGVGKSLVQFLIKTSLNADEQKKFQAALNEYRQSQAYSRNFRASINHNGSFLGRDFKQLIQIIPVILRNTFPDQQKEGIIALTTKCFDSLGCLCSLAYMRNITGDIEAFLGKITDFVDELTARVLDLDNFCIKMKKTPFCVLSRQPKLHTLHHMVEDIRRFGLPVHYETEHGEQFNKFIREEILRTNRHNPSRDIAVAFARRFMIHHVINGGSFLTTYEDPVTKKTEIRRVVHVSSGIAKLREERPEFFDLVFDHRENADNNDYQEASRSVLNVNTSGLFFDKTQDGSGLFYGTVTKVEKNPAKYTIQKYELEQFNALISSIHFCSYQSPLFPRHLTTMGNNIVMKPVGDAITVLSEDVELKQRLDMHSKIVGIHRLRDRKLLNVHKFGSLWKMLSICNQ